MKITKNLLNKLIKEESKKVLKEGLLEDIVEQSDSLILSMLDTRGFRTRGFIEEAESSIRMMAEKQGKDPIKVLEEEMLRFHRGMDDLEDRISRTLASRIPAGHQASYVRGEEPTNQPEAEAIAENKLTKLIKEELERFLADS